MNTFGLYEGPVDLAVHAPNTRYLVRQYLAKKSQESREEEEIIFDMAKVSNCGLCIQTAHGEIRVLKAPTDGVPKALSDARIRFSSNHQLTFPFAEEGVSPSLSLNIFVLWKMDSDFKYAGMQIACPRRARDNGEIDCYWTSDWHVHEGINLVKTTTVDSSDLDEITALPIDDVKKSQA